MSTRPLLRLQRLFNWWFWPVRAVALVVLLGIHGPLQWTAAAILGISALVDLVVSLLEWRQRRAAEVPLPSDAEVDSDRALTTDPADRRR
jgi:hypothetical protein